MTSWSFPTVTPSGALFRMLVLLVTGCGAAAGVPEMTLTVETVEAAGLLHH